MNGVSRISGSIGVEGSDASVAEMQGLYGPFSFSEKLLQRIWRTRDFDENAAVLSDGRRLGIRHPGRWNLLGGPDFRDARLVFDDDDVRGDVELHLHAEDWRAHGHAADVAYDRVVLHVVLFPPDPEHRSRDRCGVTIPCLALLPLLRRGLEEFATEEAVERLAGTARGYPVDGLAAFETGARDILLAHAKSRFAQKVRFAAGRVAKLGWEQACHHAALEILGYRFNRAPMCRIADRWPLADWRASAPRVDEMLSAELGSWMRQGSRPANLPRVRLEQYSTWVRTVPDWPERLRELARWAKRSRIPLRGTGNRRNAERLPSDTSSDAKEGVPLRGTGRTARRSVPTSQMQAFRSGIRKDFESITGGAIGGNRFDTLVCDGFLPLLTADGVTGLEALWLDWTPGDQPPIVIRTLKELDLAGRRGNPLTHGLCQGFLGWLIEQEQRNNR